MLDLSKVGIDDGVEMYATELTLQDNDTIYRKAAKFNRVTEQMEPGSYQDIMVCTIIQMCVDKDGNKLFAWDDKDALRTTIKAKAVQLIHSLIMELSQSPADIEKN